MATETKESHTTESSEFGAGVVVCLSKFSEHIHNPMAIRVVDAHRWMNMTDDRRQEEQENAERYPYGDASMREMNRKSVLNTILGFGNTEENQLSSAIEMWANGASDHFYDLDRVRAPQPLIELADMVLLIGHGFTSQVWTMEHWEKFHDLWRQSCLAVDKQLGCCPDWGQW